ncbi:putative reverse transcriptase zinc-binding domain-containing protein [Helianthus annuus]|nr:putative reverse transcriptase zinc-binding domain-containing protein [Helianthus annuus]
MWGGESPILHLEASELWEECSIQLKNVQISNKSDTWLWKQGDGREAYKVSSLRAELDGICTIPETQVLRWLHWIPSKINCFLWRAVLDRIPTRDALALRNIYIPSTLCVLCNTHNESMDHLLISCQYSHLVWTVISLWVKIPLPRYLISIVGLLEHIDAHSVSKEKKKAVYLIIAATCWTLWRIRNNVIFNGKATQISRAISDIKALSYLWIKARAGFVDLEWKEWVEFKYFK